MKDIQRKDYKKNKDASKECGGMEKTMDKMKDYSRLEKQNGHNYDMGKQNMKKIGEIREKLEKKMLVLAEMQTIPEKQTELIHVLDTLFDAKKLHQ